MMDRDDLLVAYRDPGGSGRTFHRRVNETDLASLGLVQAPVCGECKPPCPRDTDGDGNCGQRLCPVCGEHPCPSCGGTGFGRLIPAKPESVCAKSGYCALSVSAREDPAIDQEDDTP